MRPGICICVEICLGFVKAPLFVAEGCFVSLVSDLCLLASTLAVESNMLLGRLGNARLLESIFLFS